MFPAVNRERTKVPKVILHTFLLHKIDFASAGDSSFHCVSIDRKVFFQLNMKPHKLIHMNRVKQRDDSDTETREQEALETPTHNRLNIRSLLVVLLFDSHTQFDKLCLLFTLLCERLCYGCGNGFFALLSSWVWAWNCRYPFCFDLFNTHTHTLMKYETQKHEMKLGSHRVKCMFICIDFQSNHQQQHTTTIKSKNHFIRSNFGFALVAALQMKYER